jgi:hypothetical protein
VGGDTTAAVAPAGLGPAGGACAAGRAGAETGGEGAAAGAGRGAEVGAATSLAFTGSFMSSLIRSTVAESRLAKALTLTSRPHFWIFSSSSGLFRPSSLANSCTRVDKGNSSG